MSDKLLEHDNGKMKTTTSLFGICLLIFLSGWFIVFGIGGAIGISVGVSLVVIFLILTVVFGFASVCGFIDWLEGKKMSQFFDNLESETKKLLLSATIFIVFLLTLLSGVSLIPSYFAVPIVILGIIGTIVGAIGLIACLIDWWDNN